MSLTGALNTAVSALKAQSTAIAMISDNLANSSTYGYKTTSPSFASLVTGATTSTSYSSGGVIAGGQIEHLRAGAGDGEHHDHQYGDIG